MPTADPVIGAVLASSSLLSSLLDGAFPAFGVLIATAVVTVVGRRRAAVKATATELAKVKASEVPPWGVELQEQNKRIIRSLYGDPPWGAKGFFDTFEDFRTEVRNGLRTLNGGGEEK